jgi:hypothetical protein
LGRFGADDAGFGLVGEVLVCWFKRRGREEGKKREGKKREGKKREGKKMGNEQLWRWFGLAQGFGCRSLGSGCRRIWIGWRRRRGGGMRLPTQLESGAC